MMKKLFFLIFIFTLFYIADSVFAATDPCAPDLLSPANGDRITLPVTIQWEKDKDKDCSPFITIIAYKYEVAKSGQTAPFISGEVNANTFQAQLPTCSETVTFGCLEAGRTYQWRVGAKKSDGSYVFAPVRSFTALAPSAVAGVIGTPSLLSPADGQLDVPLPITLRWGSVTPPAPGVTIGYFIEGSSEIFTSGREWTTNTSYFIAKTLVINKEYNWRVRACFGPNQPTNPESSCGSWSQFWKFTPTLDKPKNPAPSSGATISPDSDGSVTLKWGPVSGADKYKVLFKKTTEPTYRTLGETAYQQASYKVPKELLDLYNWYNWKVIGIQGNKEGPESDEWRFLLSIGVPTPEFPPDGAMVPLPLGFLKWSLISQANNYFVELFGPKNITLQLPQNGTTSGTTINVSGITFQSGERYTWKVTPYKEGIAGPTGGPWSFTIITTTALTQGITASKSEVLVGESFTITVTGVTTDPNTVVSQLGLYIPSQDKWKYSKLCGTAACSDTFTISESQTGSYEYLSKAFLWNNKSQQSSSVDMGSVKVTVRQQPSGAIGPTGPSGISGCGTNEICNPLRAGSIPELINIIANFIFWIAMAIAPIMIVVAGFLYVTAAGDPGRIKMAKDIILYTVIGLVIILLAKTLISVIRGALGG